MPNVYFKLIYTYSFIMLHSCVDKYMQKQMVTEFLNHLHIYNPALLSQVLAYSFWYVFLHSILLPVLSRACQSKQRKEIEGNNTIGQTRDLFKKIRDTKGTLHSEIGTVKDRNITDLTEAKDIKKRQQEYTEVLYKK